MFSFSYKQMKTNYEEKICQPSVNYAGGAEILQKSRE